jgi:hypothetical protein
MTASDSSDSWISLPSPPSPCPQVTEEDLEEIKNKAACSIKTVIHRTDTREEDRAGESIRRGLVVNVGKKILSFSLLISSCLLLCLSLLVQVKISNI